MIERIPRVRRARCRTGAAFTLIEVMISLGVMMIGAMAIIAMQQQAIVANMHSRELTTASQIGQTWLERLKQDAHTWTLVGFLGVAGQPTAAQVLGGTQYLINIDTDPGKWFSPPTTTLATSEIVSAAFDYEGNDLDLVVTPDAQSYCASYRLTWVFYGRAIRADVRVHWPNYRMRTGSTNPYGKNLWKLCNINGQEADIDTGGSDVLDYHFVRMQTVIRVNNLVN